MKLIPLAKRLFTARWVDAAREPSTPCSAPASPVNSSISKVELSVGPTKSIQLWRSIDTQCPTNFSLSIVRIAVADKLKFVGHSGSDNFIDRSQLTRV